MYAKQAGAVHRCFDAQAKNHVAVARAAGPRMAVFSFAIVGAMLA
jgi:hypothetical protein